ncbi:MAG: hypothetical protein HYX20_00460 [Candidatus Yanofskybacteria bacterium]|nr:hypothetical protein [Candidatus Yanofskybacteria bacterium]
MANQIITQILSYLLDFSDFAQKITGNVNISGLRYDWLIIFFFVFVILLVAMSLGRSRMLLALLSLYIAVFLEPHFVYFDKLREAVKNMPDYWLRIGLFFLIYGFVSVILNRSVLKHRLTLAESSIAVVVLIAAVEMGFLATILLSYFPPELLERVPPKLIPYFATKTAQFWWAVVPIFMLVFSKKKPEIKREV